MFKMNICIQNPIEPKMLPVPLGYTLSGPASFFATEPKIRTFEAPCLAASAKISGRFSCNSL
jgi:hypothetical protein